MQTHDRYCAVFGKFLRLADVEFEEAMFFWEEHDQIGFVFREVFLDPIFDPGVANIMNFRIEVFKLIFPAFALKGLLLFRKYLAGFYGYDVEAGTEVLAKVFEKG